MDFDPYGIASEQEKALLIAEHLGKLPRKRGPTSYDPTGGLLEQMAPPKAGGGVAQAPQPQGLEALLGDADFMRSLGPLDKEQEALQRQQMLSERLMGSNSYEKRSSPLGVLLSGIGDTASAARGASMLPGLAGQKQELAKREALAQERRPMLERAMELDKRKRADEVAGAGQNFTAEQNRLAREARAAEAAAEMAAREKEAARNRALQRELVGADASRAAEKAAVDAKGAESERSRKIETDLREKLLSNPQARGVQSSGEFYRQITGAPDNGVGDLSRIYGLAKMYDPQGRVTDSDAEQAAKTGGLPGQLQGIYNQLQAAGSLSPKARAEMNAEAERIMRERVKAYQPLESSFRKWATDYGVDPGKVIPDFGVSGFMSDGKQPAGQMPAEVSDAVRWLQENPGHPSAPAVRQKLQQMAGGQ